MNGRKDEGSCIIWLANAVGNNGIQLLFDPFSVATGIFHYILITLLYIIYH